MRRIARLLVIAETLLAASTATATTGRGFSTPVRLPTNGAYWRFAVNDRGQAVGVEGSSTGAVIVELGSSGALGRSWLMRIPAHVGEAFSPSVALSDNGDVAVGVRYLDGQQEGCYEEHCGGPCCARVAIASWKLGEAPPLAQAVSPRLAAANESGQQPGSPSLVIGRAERVTALWARGSTSGESHGEVEDAFGRVGGKLHTQPLLTAPYGVQLEDLHLAPDGSAVASWLGYGTGLQTVSELPVGGLRLPGRFQRLSHLVQGIGFSHDYDGDTIFSYLTGESYEPSRLEVMISHDGGPFRGPRVVASLPANVEEPSVYAGGNRSLLAIWTYDHGDVEHYFARRGSVSGSLGRTMEVERTRPPVVNVLSGFIDARGRSLIIHRGPAVHRREAFELDALSDQPGRPFGRRVRIAPGLQDCGLNLGEEVYAPPIASSPNGRAVFYVTCTDQEGQYASQYLIRYTP
jgi:hypothetical protein